MYAFISLFFFYYYSFNFIAANLIPDIGDFMLALFPQSIDHIINW